VALKAIPPNQFQNCFEGWTRRWHQRIALKGSSLKATRVVFSNEVCSTFTAMSSRTLLSDHVYVQIYLYIYIYIYIYMYM
jgi:hypothetical protein